MLSNRINIKSKIELQVCGYQSIVSMLIDPRGLDFRDAVRDVSFQELSESTSTSSDSVVQVEPRENGNAEPDEVVSASRKRPAPATADQGLPESSGISLKDPSLKNEFARASCSTDVRKSVKRRYEPKEGFDASWSQLKFRTNGTDGASTSGHVRVDSLNIGNQCTGDSGVLEPALEVGQDLLGGREKLKETADFKLADEEEWARRQEELHKQVSTLYLMSRWTSQYRSGSVHLI